MDNWQFNDSDRHVLFFDDFIEKIADAVCGVSVDENLELMHRGSDPWKVARQFRLKATIYRSQNIARHTSVRVEKQIEDLNQEIEKTELKQNVQSVSGGNEKPDKKKLAQEQQALRELKMKRTRLQDHLEKCRKMIKEVPLAATTVADKKGFTKEPKCTFKSKVKSK